MQVLTWSVQWVAATCFLLAGAILPSHTLAQARGEGGPPRGGGPPLRYHEVVQSEGVLSLVRADVAPISASEVTIEVVGDQRVIRSNGIAQHQTGVFPNADNPNTISPQNYTYTVSADPELTGNPTPSRIFGVCLNGVPLDPGAAEFYHGDMSSGWQYEALSGAVPLGLDDNYAHVQPTGAYHYHATPTLLLMELRLSSASHSPLVGWAADGFPIYAVFGYGADGSGVRELLPSYILRSGSRPDGEGQPGGVYDGTFSRDYEYVDGVGDFDQCNGMLTTTPEFPDGTYAYFLTNEWPFVPRCHMGTPSEDFSQGPGPGGPPTAIWRGSWGGVKQSGKAER